MRTATMRVGAAFILAAAGVAASHSTANAEPAAPNVKYTLSSATGVSFQVNYIVTQPPSMDAYNHDAYTYLKKDEVPTGEPWVFETTLEDPQWAFIDASAAAHGGQAPAFPICEISVDGQVVAHTEGQPYAARCALSQWH